MLRTIVTSVAEATAILLCAGFCLFLTSYIVQKDSWSVGPLVILVLYFLPIGVASVRKHNAVLNIMVVNLWLGWTVLGWIVALVWACDTDVETADA